jgi:hypothetical protein
MAWGNGTKGFLRKVGMTGLRHPERSRGISSGTQEQGTKGSFDSLSLAQDDIQGKTEHTIIPQGRNDRTGHGTKGFPHKNISCRIYLSFSGIVEHVSFG